MDLESNGFPDAEPLDWSELLHAQATKKSFGQGLADSLANQYASLLIFLRTLCLHFETALVVAVAAASPCFYYYYNPDGKVLAFNLSWTIITVAAAFPLTMTLNAVFTRRETGLVQMSNFKANVVSIFLAHRDWDWWTLAKQPTDPSTSGRLERLPCGHVKMVHRDLKRLVAISREVLTAPIVSRGRHLYSKAGRKEKKLVEDRIAHLNTQMVQQFHRLSAACEELKSSGLPANEAARLRQYLTNAIAAWNQLRALKNYRTPLGLRSFSRVYIFVTPLMFGPYYAQLAASTTLAFAVALSVMTTTAMQGLFNLRYSLEDPFDLAACADAIDVAREADEIHTDLDILCAHPADPASLTTAPARPPGAAPPQAAAAAPPPWAAAGGGVEGGAGWWPGRGWCGVELEARPSLASATSTIDAEISWASSGL